MGILVTGDSKMTYKILEELIKVIFEGNKIVDTILFILVKLRIDIALLHIPLTASVAIEIETHKAFLIRFY